MPPESLPAATFNGLNASFEPETPQQTDPLLSALHRIVNCYLSTLETVANSLGNSCPPIGGLYRHRLSRLRTRLAFDSSPDAMEESCDAVEVELYEFANKAAAYLNQHGIQLRAGISVLEEIVRALAQRQDFYGTRLRQFAAQMEATAYPTDPEHLQEVVALQVAGLLSCVESMSHETQSLVTRMQSELTAVEQRLKESEVTDPLTGLMNRREMERQIEARKGSNSPLVLLHFELSGVINDEVAKQVAARLGSQFRHKDYVCRWTEDEFLVLFQGPPEIAQMRAEQIVPWVAGRYALTNGDSVQVDVEWKLASAELVA
jgi:GGDEF domain-containing protein